MCTNFAIERGPHIARILWDYCDLPSAVIIHGWEIAEPAMENGAAPNKVASRGGEAKGNSLH